MLKRNALNIITNLSAMILSFLVGFIITPIITSKLGFEAYSYVSIITNLLAFMSVITYTLNSMVGRFYTVAYNSQDAAQSNRYISTALITCLAIGAVVVGLFSMAVFYLDKLIVINTQLINDVKTAFYLSGISFVLSSISAVFSTGTYCKNRLEISNLINMFANAVRLALIIVLFSYLNAHIWFIGLTAIVQMLISITLGYVSFKKLIPEVTFSRHYFNTRCMKELLSAGLFNAVILMGTNLITQIDILVGNRLFGDGDLLGRYATILLFSNTLRSISSALSSAFSPTTLKLYASNDHKALMTHSNKVVEFCGTIIGWPASLIASVGPAFLSIWLRIDYTYFKYIIIIMILPLAFTLATSQLTVVNQAYNKLKIPALASIATGVLNLGLAILLAKKYGLLGIAAASAISFSIQNLVFLPIYTAVLTKQAPWAYYRGLVIPFSVSIMVCLCSLGIQRMMHIDTIMKLLAVCAILSGMYALLVWLFLGKKRRSELLRAIKK